MVGHNLKIAWNLMRMTAIAPKHEYRDAGRARSAGSCRRSAATSSAAAGTTWSTRTLGEGERQHRFVWHDRKAWWQQEQAILAYLILAGETGDDGLPRGTPGRRPRSTTPSSSTTTRAASTSTCWPTGMPYLLGNERLKGSHSMSMYHSAELCYLATVYTRLLLTGDPLTLHFKPKPDAFVSPTAASGCCGSARTRCRAGRVKLDWVEVDGRPYGGLRRRRRMTVKLPETDVRPQGASAPACPSSDD